ncbi:MAG TPA: hypothetical protein VJB94_05905 [Candidatus Nanoarchaeia archaeon]|nr:hypothetical protein [Candidatus Nanoarchaeia archaeon]
MKKNQEKRVKYIFIGLFIFLAIILIFALVRQQTKVNERFFDYNGFKVEKTIEGYKLGLYLNNAKDPVYLRIREDPREIDNISIGSNVKNDILSKKQIYTVIDPEENLTGVTTLAALELDKVIDNPFLFNIPLNSAFVKDFKNYPVKNCQDVDETIGIIWLRLGEETKVYSENGCVFVEADKEENLVKAANKLDLVLLGMAK